MSTFRAAGLNYLQYSNIAARMLRRALKPEKRADAAKREESHVRFTPWKDGKPASQTKVLKGLLKRFTECQSDCVVLKGFNGAKG